MKISYDWLKKYIKTNLPIDKISEILTDIGLEIEGVEKVGISKEDLEGFVVGHVLKCYPHPNADKLKITEVDLGTGETVQIVCGAPNIAENQKVPVATIGTSLKSAQGESFKIKKAKLRGELSHGMICSERELNISDKHDGIMVLNNDLKPGTPISEILDTSTDYIFEIGLTPNRADAMSHYGVARDLHAALTSKKINSELINPFKEELESSAGPFSIEIEDPEVCPAYYGAYIEGVEVKESPAWLKKHLASLGLKSTNNIVDVTNYILHGLGQPLHAFDTNYFSTNVITIKSGFEEKIQTLDKTERILEKTDLIISNNNKPLAIAGVMGGEESSVKENTKNIFIESAYFNPVNIRKTAKRLGINSDASFRYERGIDPNITGKALENAIDLIIEVAGGKVVQRLKNRVKEIENFNVVLQYRKLDALVGERIHRQKIKEILAALDIEIISETSDILDLSIPPYRVDVQREVDVIEDILRIYGYNNVPQKEKISYSIVGGTGFDKNLFINNNSDLLVSNGFFEAMNISMYSQEMDENTNSENDNSSIELINSLSKEYTVMRRSLIPELLKNITYNVNRKIENVCLFEIGHVYEKIDDKIKESFMLGLAASGITGDNHWKSEIVSLDIFYLKGIIETLFKSIGLSNFSFHQEEGNLSIIFLGKVIGKIKNYSKADKIFDLPQDAVAAEIDLQILFEAFSKNNVQYNQISKYPVVYRDLALLLDNEVHFEDILRAINGLNINEIKNTSLFDVYEGEKLNGKKSYAIRLEISNPNKTMTDKEIDKIMNKVIHILEQDLKANLRK